ncbi:MAG: hypothetical protein H8E87_05275 [FCB group bacterium]|nr:hypothetical protein [FCB group bacterium]
MKSCRLRYNTTLVIGAFLILISLGIIGCSSGVYFLDQPVSDPIMSVDDNQNSDIFKSEEGGAAGGSGSCPT